ncbi:MAG: NMD3-related protein [Promethearchaeota archaeon]
MPNRFCAICGKTLVGDEPHFGMCLECYLKEHPLFELPDHFSLNICLDCGSFSKKDEWIEPLENDFFSIIKQATFKFILKSYVKKNNINFKISFNEDSFVFSSKDLLTSLEIIIKGILKEDTNIYYQNSVKLNLNHILCKNCSNLRGGTYFLSIIQLRVKDEEQFGLIKYVIDEINTFTDRIFKEDHRQYISKMEDQKYGVDLYLSTIELMNYIIKFLKSKYNFLLNRTKKLVGRDNQRGKNLYRFKALIKFLPLSNNDIIIIKNQDFRVENITKNKVILRGENNTKLIKDYSYFFNEKIIKKNL